ncbi:hypothetical protein TWF192_001255 [Orbilia oligospora]|uniref:Uncharacterized protein n=1 Tax=Orbilia oligospora TaxID=2813651 RepID=A0A6G1LUC5_ORBOL|nr:hypothetical protein TWF191_004727 [Orbilia oligospora]KAF3234582.1 hypothetical protein TWF192_001255 [Orbilia oligospora]
MGPTAPAQTSPPNFLDTLEDFTWSWKSGRAITLLIVVVCFAFVETALGFFALGDELRAKPTDPVELPAPNQDVAAQDKRDKLAVAIAAAVTTVDSVDLASTINDAVAAAVDAAVTAAIDAAVAAGTPLLPDTAGAPATMSTNVAVDPSADANITANSTGAGAASGIAAGAAAVGSFAIRCDDRGVPGGATADSAATSRDNRPILASSIIVAKSLAIKHGSRSQGSDCRSNNHTRPPAGHSPEIRLTDPLTTPNRQLRFRSLNGKSTEIVGSQVGKTVQTPDHSSSWLAGPAL